MRIFRFVIPIAALCCLLTPGWIQGQGRFLQAELETSIKTKRIKPGDPVTFKTTASGTLPDGSSVGRGVEIYGEVKSAEANSVTVALNQIEIDGKKKAMAFSIRAAMMPGGDGRAPGGAVQTGTVIGLKGVTLHVDDNPPYASKFETEGKELQLRAGLQVMLQAMTPAAQ